MSKKILKVLLVAVFAVGITKNVYAENDVYYRTANGIDLSREEYEFLTSFYWDGYPDVMTKDQYEEFVNLDLINSDVEYKVYPETSSENFIGPVDNPRSTSHSTSAKTLQIGKACLPTKCIMSLVNTWHGDPSVTSWDVIGAYMTGNSSLLSHSHTYVSTTNTTTYFNNLSTATNGIGNSVNLPDDGENLIINMAFTVSRGGRVYGSYQHAMTNTTLANSQLYNFSLGGAGGVFDFYGTAFGVYDEMNGVDIDV